MALFTRKPKPAPAPPARSRSPQGAAPPRSGSDEARIDELGRDMLARARAHKSGLLSAKFYSDALMNWSMKDPAFKVQLFRFVDAFPMLKDPAAVFDHLKDYLGQPGVTVPGVIEAALKAGGLAKGLAAGQISRQIAGMAGKFIAGTDAASALPNLKGLWSDGIAFSVDLLGEACLSDDEADHYQAKYLDLIGNLPAQVAGWPADPRLESDHLGPIPRTNVSIKISSLSARCDPIDTEGSITDLMRRLTPILETARDRGVFVNFDMEQFALKDLTIELFQRCCGLIDFEAGLAMQAYLRSGEEDARRVADWARATGRVVTVRLVKGAYWDYQVINAEGLGWPVPVWTAKRETDACFERMTAIFLDACPATSPGAGVGGAASAIEGPPAGVKLALGSHNVRSIAAALAALERRGLPRNALEIQMLHGMADQLKHAASNMGLRVREYVPVGDMIPGMAYLVRRLLENTSNESWLKAGFLDGADPAVLLAAPHGAVPGDLPVSAAPIPPDPLSAAAGSSNGHAPKPAPATDFSAPERHNLSASEPGVGDGRPFFNEPFRDFSHRPVREAFAAAVARARVPQVANDRTPEDAARMVGVAAGAFEAGGWRDADPLVRCRVLTRAAALMREGGRRDELAGVMIKEAGKTWREADADVCEAIDFCEYYARTAPRLFRRERIGRFIGELDESFYQPRGVAVVIAPWNFPQAILCGMTAAALVTGNTVIVKPAEQTPGIAKAMVEIFHRAMGEAARGLPAESILQLCPAPGETTGAALVRDPRVSLIAFTGSKAVGLEIIKAAAVTSETQGHLKHVVCEMGGKNALIIDTSADLDEAVLAARGSAFGFQGQKCSACSRLIVVDPEGEDGPAIRTVVTRLVGATKALTVGDPTRPGTDIGPVIDDGAAATILRYIDLAKGEGCRLELGSPPSSPAPSPSPGGGGAELRGGGGGSPASSPVIPHRYIPPHIFSHVKGTHAIANEEVFGPVLAVMHARTFDEALAMANASPYKLTGGVFSRKPSNIEKAKREFRVGNLYINRGTTGALVARQPFGGFGMSGGGTKAGGPDYLLHFVEPRAVCENTLRRGFAPEL